MATQFGYIAGIYNADSFSKVQLSDMTVVSDLTLPGGTNGWRFLAFDSTQTYMYVSNGFTNISKIDVSSFTVVSTLSNLINSTCVVMDPTSEYLYTAGAAWNNYIVKIDVSTFSVVSSINVASRDLVMDSKGEYLYAVNGSYLYKIDLSTFSVVSTLPLTSNLLYIDPTETYLYVGQVRVILSTFTEDTTYSSSYAVYAVDPQGVYGYEVLPSSGEVVQFDVSTGLLVATLGNFSYPTQVSVAPSGEYAVVVDNTGDYAYAVPIPSFTSKGVGLADNIPDSPMQFGPGAVAPTTSQMFVLT